MSAFTFTEKMERGQYSVNIATSLALESLMGIHPDRQWPEPPHQRFDDYWLNLRTLYRNVVGAFTADINTLLKPGVIAELMMDEWVAIQRVLERTELRHTLYLSNYSDVERRYKHHTNFRNMTPKQEDEQSRMMKSIQQFIHDGGKDFLVTHDHDLVPKTRAGRTVIQTHIALDLLSYGNFDDLELLESHTGAIKNRSLWYTKYNNGKDLSMIPFTQYFLRVFGDREFFASKDAAFRKALVELGTKYNWNSLTTDSRVRLGIEQLKNPYYIAVLKDMM